MGETNRCRSAEAGGRKSVTRSIGRPVVARRVGSHGSEGFPERKTPGNGKLSHIPGFQNWKANSAQARGLVGECRVERDASRKILGHGEDALLASQ